MKNKIKKYLKMYHCALCGRVDRKTHKEAREGKLIAICEDCGRKN